MRHRKAGRKFNMGEPARRSLLRNLVVSLLLHGRIRTTEARAKEIRRFTERVITIARKAPTRSSLATLEGDAAATARAARVHAIRQARLWVNDDQAMTRLFEEYAINHASRPGGYTRVVKAGFRPGDNAAMAFIEIVQDAAAAEAASE